MAENIPEIESRAELDGRIAEILARGSLYRRFVYNATNCHFSRRGAYEEFKHAYLPETLRMFCESKECQQETIWKLPADEIEFYFDSTPRVRTYVCRNCESAIKAYWLVWEETATGGIFVKVGQWPPLAIQPPQELAKALGPEDADLYR